jgi:hypothetical protein
VTRAHVSAMKKAGLGPAFQVAHIAPAW